MRVLVCAAVAALLLSVPIADSMAFMPESGTSPWLGSEFRPVVGHYSEYLMTPEGEKPITMLIAIVEKEGDAYWYEVVMTLEGQGKMITKKLVSGDPDNEENIERMIMKSGDEPAMEMPVQMMKMMGPDGGLPQMAMQGEEEPEAEEAGLGDVVEVRLGDALETLKEVPEPLDLVFLDGWKDLYVTVLELLKPKLRPGAVVLGDNISNIFVGKALRPYVDYVQSGESGFESVTLRIADGTEYSCYLG